MNMDLTNTISETHNQLLLCNDIQSFFNDTADNCQSFEQTSENFITLETAGVGQSNEDISIEILPRNYQNSTTACQDQELQQLLEKWNIVHVYPLCEEHRINLPVLRLMTPKYMEKFFTLTKMDLGTQIIFSHNLGLWQASANTTITSDLSSLSTSLSYEIRPNAEDISETESERTLETNFDIMDVLSKISEGRSILNYYKVHSKLNEGCRKIMLDAVINFVMQRDIKWSIRFATLIAKNIKIRFPTEVESYYFMKEPGKTPLGALYMKYYNVLRKLKNSGLKEKRPYKKKDFKSRPDLPNIFEPETNIVEKLSIIEEDNCTWAELEQLWSSTTNYRVSKIIEAQSTADILVKWKQYKRPMGYKLIDLDFKTMYPTSASLLNTFHNHTSNFLAIIKQKVKDVQGQKLLVEFEKLEHRTENCETSFIFYLLHAILCPTNKEVELKDNKKRIIKYSIKDSQNSFIMVGATIAELEGNLEKLANLKDSIQPLIMVSGNILSPNEIIVFFDGIKYKFNSILNALDICFKINMLFNLRYPRASTHVWTFIQKFFYNITTKFDQNHPSINILINSMKN